MPDRLDLVLDLGLFALSLRPAGFSHCIDSSADML
jgi:hypothetical protein